MPLDPDAAAWGYLLQGHFGSTGPQVNAGDAGPRVSSSRIDLASQLAQRHFLNRMVFLLGENEIGALARGQNIFVQIGEVDPLPDRSCGGDSIGVGELRVAVEI